MEEDLKRINSHDQLKLTDKIDACFKTLYESPSEKTVKTAHELEDLFKEWRDECVNAIFKNMANLSQSLVNNLQVMGIRFYTEKPADGASA